MYHKTWCIAAYTRRYPPHPADCLLSSDQRLRDSVCGRVERGAGLGMSGAGTTQAAAWPSVPNWTQSAGHCVQCDAKTNMGGKVGLICCWTRELWRSKCNFLCICYLLLHKCCRVCLVRVAGVIKPRPRLWSNTTRTFTTVAVKVIGKYN